MKNKLSFEEMEQVLLECCKNGFKPIPLKERIKMLKEQKKKVEETEKCFKVSREQLQRQFTIWGNKWN